MQRFHEFAVENLSEIVRQLSNLCAMPSVADRPEVLQATAEHVAQAMEACGLSARLLSAGGPPVVYAEHLVPGKPTVLFYDHYDVQPPGDQDAWRFPAFVPRKFRRRLYARGAVDNKGDLVARLWALRAWRELYGELPTGVRFVVEGEEEIGSPHLAAFVEAHAEILQADGCIWEAGEISARGRPYLFLGLKGMLGVEMEAKGATGELHSAWATIAPNPVWRLLWALSRLKSPDEEVLIEGFYDQVEGPTHEQIRQSRRLPFPEKELLNLWQVPSFLHDLSGGTLRLAQFYSPTCNISGFEGGRADGDPRSIIPSSARARVDFRLVPRQRPEDVLDLLRKYLVQQGFGDIVVHPQGPMLSPFRTQPDAPFARAVVEATRRVFRYRPAVFPNSGGSGPMCLFGEKLGMPVVSLGIGHTGANIHGANENVRLSDLRRGVVHVAAILGRVAEGLER